MNNVRDVLDELGYTEICHDDHDDWTPLDDDHHDYGTTEDTRVILEDERPRVRLVDPGTGEEIARARAPATTTTTT